MRIDIKPLDLEEQTISESTELFIELTPTYVRYKAKFTAEELTSAHDPYSGWTTKQRDFDWRIHKNAITSIDRTFLSDQKIWKIILTVTGSNVDVDIYIRRQSECERVYEIIFNYLFDILCPASSL